MKHKEELGALLTAEQGKPLSEAIGEIVYGAGFLEVYADRVTTLSGDLLPTESPAKVVVQREPIGVVAAITPWNFPSAMITRKCGAAIAAGCTVVLKPSELTPFSALALCELAERAGFPAGVLNCVTGDAAEIGGEMTSNPLVRKLTFTGSTRVGKLLAAQCAATLKRVSLELGGNAPFIVFDDANLEKAVAGLMAAKFRNMGQACVAANRVFVQAGVYDKFAELLAEKMRGLKLGDGSQPGVTQGPLINQAAVEKVDRQVKDAIEKGGRIVMGGTRGQGTFYPPTLLLDAKPNMLCFSEETFGPLVPLFKFTSEEEVVKMANDTPYGLAAYVFTEDSSRQWRMAESLEYGMVGVNQGSVSSPWAPFGGIKHSGYGREGSKYGLDDYLQMKTVHFGMSKL